MKLKSITLALSFVAVSSVIANETVTIAEGTFIEVTNDKAIVTSEEHGKKVVVSVSAVNQEAPVVTSVEKPAATEEAAVSTETQTN